jgi:hypothetical protein
MKHAGISSFRVLWSSLVVIIPVEACFLPLLPIDLSHCQTSKLRRRYSLLSTPHTQFPCYDCMLVTGLQIRILLIRQWHSGSLSHLLVVLVHQLLVNLDFGRSKRNLGDELQSLVADKLSSKPQERLLKVIV